MPDTAHTSRRRYSSPFQAPAPTPEANQPITDPAPPHLDGAARERVARFQLAMENNIRVVLGLLEELQRMATRSQDRWKIRRRKRWVLRERLRL